MLNALARTVRLTALSLAVAAWAAPAWAAPAGDFPPGTFSDNGNYKLADFEGKLLVLFFYEQNCPRCRGLIPERNKLVEQFKGKPVKFIAVAPGDTTVDALAYVRGTQLKMPAFSDLFGVMQRRYGTQISLNNIYQAYIITPKGDMQPIGDLTAPPIERALQNVSWKYKDAGYDAALSGPIELLEWNQYEAGVKALRPFLKHRTKSVAESANRLMGELTTQAKTWMDDAAKAVETEPARAFDLYSKVAGAFAGDELGKQADEALKSLRKNKAVTDELAARAMYNGLSSAFPRAQMNMKPAFIAQARAIANKYPETPTGKKAAAFADELDKATAQ
jgi:thiol-disulfide isomerase/thioredoxin